MIQPSYLIPRSKKRGTHIPAELPICANDHDLHRTTPVCGLTSKLVTKGFFTAYPSALPNPPEDGKSPRPFPAPTNPGAWHPRLARHQFSRKNTEGISTWWASWVNR